MTTSKNPCRTCVYRFEMRLSTQCACDRCEHNEFNNILSFPDEKYHYTTTTTHADTTPPLYSTTQPNTNMIEKEELPFQKGLPMRDEYMEKLNPFKYTLADWSEPKYICPECGGNMRRNEVCVFASNPPMRMYQCDKCTFVEFLRA